MIRARAAMVMAALSTVLGGSPSASHSQNTRAMTERHRKAEQAAKKRGRSPVAVALEKDIIDAAESKRERKAAKAARDIARSKAGGRG